MARKQEAPPAGAPAWMTTYGDMITLLVCFFVLLFTMMELKQPRVTMTMRQFQKQFGVLPNNLAQPQVYQQPMTMSTIQTYVLRRGPKGNQTAVKTIVEDQKTKITLGGNDFFRPDSAELTPKGKQILKEGIAPGLRGFNNRIDIRGHTASAVYDDGWHLGFARALAVTDFLINDCDIDARRIRATSCSDHEPLATNQTPQGRAENRRVEIIMTEEVIKDLDAKDL